MAAHLAEALYQQGRYEEAEQVTHLSEAAAAADDFASQAGWRSVRAKVRARRGEPDEAHRLAQEAVAMVEGTDYIDTHGDLLMDLAEVLELTGRQGAREASEKALALYERKGNLVSAARARARLAELAS